MLVERFYPDEYLDSTYSIDFAELAKKGYHTKQATPVDMFPWTKAEHVETVCLLEKGKK